jgi:Protein tyrosine/serine phosphatase
MQIRYIEAFFLSDDLNELNIVTDLKTLPKYDLFWTYDLDKNSKNRHFILADTKKNIQFQFTYDQTRRQYFIIEFETGKNYLFGHRILPIAGMYNFRDIGGYLTTTGKRIKWGIGYRSDYLYNLKDEGMKYIQSLELKTIIDFRTNEEIIERPNRKINENIENHAFDPNAHIARLAGTLQSNSILDDNSIIEISEKIVATDESVGNTEMINQQLKFVDSADAQTAFTNTLKVLANKDAHPSMQHCRGGKDRTGYALMLLEGLLGVSKSELIYDYFLTHRAREKKNKLYYQSFLEKTNDVKMAEYMYSLFDTKKEYIEASIAKIIDEYENFDNYAKNILKISDLELQTLRDIFLEEA